MTCLDEELIILEDLDFDPECNARDKCESKAEWSTEKTCCRRHYYFCESCRLHNENVDALYQHKEFKCNDCGTVRATVREFFTNWVRL